MATMASMASKFIRLLNLNSTSSLNPAIGCNPTSLFSRLSLRSQPELGAVQSMMPLLGAARMSAFMSTAAKGGKSSGQRQSGRTRAAPLRSKFAKHFKGRMGGIAHQGNQIAFGNYALQALDHSWITSRQIEAGRKVLVNNARRSGKIWVRIFPYKPVTQRPAEVRMGRGKGAVSFWVAVVKPGRIIYEISGVPEQLAREAITIASSKMPVRTKFICLK